MALLCLLTNTPWPWPTPARAASAGCGKSGRQASRRPEEANTWSCTELFPSPCARQEQRSFHVFLQALRARIHTPRLFLSSGQLFLFFGSCRVGNRAAFSDSRSNFHTRVGYRTNVCRRRFASDSARASEGTPAQGALEDHHDRPPGSPPEKVEQLNSSCHRSAHLLTDGPDEAGKLSRDRGDDDGGLLASGDQ
ncbi:MAG: hypothetical protein JWQ49_5162 [Edaphobacter sp.]|nr:hypothetical protein [Edaphobacter sp.]